VVVNYTNSEKVAKELVESIHKNGGKAIAVQADVGKVADIKKLFHETIKHFGALDILVNNAGIFKGSLIASTTEEDYDQIFDVNTKGTFFSLQEAAKVIRNEGRIINITTALVHSYRIANMSYYTASKAAVDQFTKGLAAELADKKVTVNSVSPAYTDTDILSAEVKEQVKSASIFNRVGTADEIAEVVGFLVSEKARWVTGQNVSAGGGATMHV